VFGWHDTQRERARHTLTAATATLSCVASAATSAVPVGSRLCSDLSGSCAKAEQSKAQNHGSEDVGASQGVAKAWSLL